jgi:hypothetical protein
MIKQINHHFIFFTRKLDNIDYIVSPDKKHCFAINKETDYEI